ncbi:DUF968 domain-containing protein [Scandinavium lactucae]|uniref:DUF968 domain-containing protein n=1 Tax=Scandinavium lactucae TaxID=3095028 RepID=A0ABU4QTK4_9ENTR|nr:MULTISPECIES: DUF968 domain-containing protein [unclassified Scandinavium]MDX6042621.1 DUF968 domain-containing protein [Scandinavium sp. V105_6]MDX6052622.1 DUF968 domain-containing protein [Scandinavium sp. V105_1]
MRALLKPEIARHMGVVLLKPGKELMSIFAQGRVLVECQPDNMAHLPSGKVPDAAQPLREDRVVQSFFMDERVIAAAGGLSSLDEWLRRRGKNCQYPHSNYHHNELVIMRHHPGSILLCWHCENELREQTTEFLSQLARENLIDWIIDAVLHQLGFNRERMLSVAELCWWASCRGIAEAIPEELARQALSLPKEKIESVYRESEIMPTVTATSILLKRTEKVPVISADEIKPIKPIVAVQVDPESPATFFTRPKRIRWESANYLRWVKSQTCACCNQPADDAHHLIGWGQGGVGTKAHDIFVIPLCRKHHTELHNDPVKFEQNYGSQPEMIKNVLDRAFALGVLA